MRPPANVALRVAVGRATRDRMTLRIAPRAPVAIRPREAGPSPYPRHRACPLAGARSQPEANVSEDLDERGKFKRGNKAAVGRAPRRDGLNLSRWFREALADPARREKLLARIDRELDGDGPAPVLVKAMAYGYGEPRQVLEADLRVRASKLAALVGVDVETLLAEANRLSREAGYETEN